MAWIILAGITVVAGIVGGSIAAGLTFVFGLVGIIWYKIDCWEKARKQRKRERPPASSHGRKSGPRTARQGSQALTARDLYEERQPGSELQWIAPGERFSVGKFDLGGMVYTTSIEHDWAAEPSAINPKLKLAARAAPTDEALPYYSSYAQLPPAQRTAYLEWLQSGRRDGSPGERELGYIFLFFYGIERRVLVENDLDPSLIAEIAELLKHYGADRKSRSFKAYLSDFLHFASFRIGTESYRTLWPSYLPLHDGHFSETALTLILANVYTLGEPLHWSIAYRIAMHHKDSRRSVVVKRTGSRFFEMFQKRYEQAFPEGLPLKAGKREQQVDYRCANASLACLGSLPILTVPKVFGLKGQFKPLPKIWNECIEELSGYSRAVARANKDESISTKEALKIHLALPEALRKPEDHPLRQTFEAILADCPSEAGVHFLPVSLLQDAIELPERETLTLKQSEQVADLISSLGRRIAPDPRVLNIPLRRTQEVGVYVDESDAPPSELMPGLLRLLYLTALVAAADGSIDGEELSVFHDSVSELPLSSSDRQAFAATEAALFRDSNIALKNLNRIAKGIVESRRSEVIHLLVRVAGADDIITNDEHRILARICRAFGLDPSSVDELVANDPAFQTVAVVAKGKSKRRGEKIPPPPNSQAEEFSIDMDLVAAISEETKEVVSILSEVLTEDEPESPDSSATPQVSGAPTPQAPDSPEWLEELEPRFHSPLLELLGAEDTSADTVKAIVKKHHLMAGDLIDSVNAWADETLGDFLLEAGDDGSLTIYHDMIPPNNIKENTMKIKRRERDSVLQSLQSGLVPRQGLHLIQVGRKSETNALLSDVERIKAGGSSFRIVVGRFGSGKSFFLNLVRTVALQQDLVVIQGDFTMERRLYATGGEARSLYSELVRNMMTRSKPDGGGMPTVCTKWISKVQHEVMSAGGDQAAVEAKIASDLSDLQELVGGFEFAEVIGAFYRGWASGDERLQANALRWLRAEYTTKTEARQDLGVRRIIDDENFYDSLKLLARFCRKAGYDGLFVALDELVVLTHRLPSSRSRTSNFEAILTLLNDAIQGKAEGIGFIFAGTDDCLEDKRRGLFSYEALRSRLAENQFAGGDIVDLSGPVIRLQSLSPEDLFVLLRNITLVHAHGDDSKRAVPDEAIHAVLSKANETLGAEFFKTPRDIVRSFVGLLNILDQNPDRSWQEILGMENLFQKPSVPQSVEEEVEQDPDGKPTEATDPPESNDDDLANFKL